MEKNIEFDKQAEISFMKEINYNNELRFISFSLFIYFCLATIILISGFIFHNSKDKSKNLEEINISNNLFQHNDLSEKEFIENNQYILESISKKNTPQVVFPEKIPSSIEVQEKTKEVETKILNILNKVDNRY